jgi:hypothetical protein
VIADDDPLLGCRLKLQQAWRHRQTLGEAIRTEWRADDPPPLRFGVILGDWLHNLRCALDHVIWQLVLLNGKKPTRSNAFPIRDTKTGFDNTVPRELRGLTASQRRLVEEFQPYRLAGDPKQHSLAVLRDLSNIDKHRFVHVTTAREEGAGEPVLLFTELAITTEALWRLEWYVTYAVYERFAQLFPLPLHAQGSVRITS